MSEVWVTAVVVAGTAAYSAYSANELYGDKPEVKPAPTLPEILTDTLNANIAGLPKAAALAGAAGDIDQANILKNLRAVMGPDFMEKATPLISKNILSGLKGEVDEDTQTALLNFDAAKGLNLTGQNVGDTGFGRKLVARDFSETSREITNKAMGSFKEWTTLSRALLSPNTPVASFLATPSMGQQVANREWDIGDYMAKIDAAPDPGTAGAFNTSLSLISSLATAYGGGNRNQNSRPWLGSAGEAGSGEGTGRGFDFGFGGRQGGTGGQWYWGNQPGNG